MGMRHSRAGTAVAQRFDFVARRFDFCAGHGNLLFYPPTLRRRGSAQGVSAARFLAASFGFGLPVVLAFWSSPRPSLCVRSSCCSSTITSGAPGFAKPHQCRYISEILLVVARSATLAVSRLFRDLVTVSATTVSWDVTSCCATVSSCCCPATWGPCCGPCSCGSRLFTLTTLHLC